MVIQIPMLPAACQRVDVSIVAMLSRTLIDLIGCVAPGLIGFRVLVCIPGAIQVLPKTLKSYIPPNWFSRASTKLAKPALESAPTTYTPYPRFPSTSIRSNRKKSG